MIGQETVRHIAALARLKLSDEQVERLGGQLADITTYINKLTQVELPKDGEILGTEENKWREDEIRKSQRPNTLLSNAPDAEAGYLKIRKIVE